MSSPNIQLIWISDSQRTRPWRHCKTLQDTATRCNTLQHAATRCNTLRNAATRCNTLQQTAPYTQRAQQIVQREHTATHCNTLQQTAAYCNTLQHTATHCNTLQHTATHCNILQHTAPDTQPAQRIVKRQHTQCVRLIASRIWATDRNSQRSALESLYTVKLVSSRLLRISSVRTADNV